MDNLSEETSSNGSNRSELSSTTSASEDRHASISVEWAHSLGLDLTIRENDTLPVALRDIVRASETVPRWILDENAPEYEFCRQFYPGMTQALGLSVNANEKINLDDDEDLSHDVRCELDKVLSIPKYDLKLRAVDRFPNKSERRIAVDYFVYHTLESPAHEDFVCMRDRTLRVPKNAWMHTGTVALDTTVSIMLPDPLFSASGLNDEVASQNFGHDEPVGFRCLLHWVIEYACEKCSNCATRKVFQGMVSALYQRRALGFLDHCVFGMAHSSPSRLDVFAATWEIPDCSTNQSVDVNSVHIPGMETDGFNHELEGPSMERMIVVYRLATFNMASPLDMLHLYLLMRATRALGHQYKTEIMNAFPAPNLGGV